MLIEPNSIINGDCLEVMKFIPDKSIDCIICDLPSHFLSFSYPIYGKIWDIDTGFDMADKRPPIVLSQSDINEIQRLYEKELWGVRRIADHFNTNHHFIQRRIDQYGFTSDEKRRQRPLTKEHCIKIGAARRRLIANGQYVPRKGYKTPKAVLYKNMVAQT